MDITELAGFEGYDRSSDIKRLVWNSSFSNIHVPDQTVKIAKPCETHMASTLNIKSIIVS